MLYDNRDENKNNNDNYKKENNNNNNYYYYCYYYYYYSNDNIVRIIDKEAWTNKKKLKLIQINRKERQKGKNFIKRIKQLWDIDFLRNKRMT